MTKVLASALVALVMMHAVAQTPASDPLDASFKPAMNVNAGAPANVWMTGSLEKVLQDKGNPGAAHSMTVSTMRNEIQSFQVHVHAGQTPVRALNVTMSDLVNARTKTRISAASTDIVVYREAYMNVHIKSGSGVTFLNTLGHIPDILIPAVDPYYHQKTNAFPFNVAAGNNQSVWIDVHTPPTAPAGYYSGTVTVSDGATVLAAMPVLYAVWEWEMPSTASLPSYTAVSYGGFCYQAYGSIPGCAAYPGSMGIADYGATLTGVDAAVEMLDNRYSLSGMINIFPGEGSFAPTNGGASFDAVYGPLLNGTPTFAGSPAHVATILKGARLTTYNMTIVPSQLTAATFQNFQKHFAANHWVTPFYYMVDEPKDDPAVWKTLVENANKVHSFTRGIPIGITTDLLTAQKHNALDAIDILIAQTVTLEMGGGTPKQDLGLYSKWLAGNPLRKFWMYQGCTDAGTCTNGVPGPQYPKYPNTFPNYNVDGTPVANRSLEWITFLNGQQGELYYYIDVCDGPGGVATQCGYPTMGTTPDPLKSVYYSGGWGDGTLMYPGSSTYVGTKTPIWLPSMRLKMIRDGMQDYEYLNALNGLGEGAFATQQARSFITNTYTFKNDSNALQTARDAMGNKIHQLTLSRGRGKTAR
ncbi:MAG TPA: hypothetical protein VGN17_31760 [Bryobacteraceae bacterium]|jgi:hypothetical protein